jgi:hypothetical protein
VSTPYRAGASVEDFCRVCKELRDHRVVAVDAQGAILRVVCGYCGSDHNFRGGRTPGERRPSAPSGGDRSSAAPPIAGEEMVSDRELAFAGLDVEGEVSDATGGVHPPVLPARVVSDLEKMLRRVIREETGLVPVAPAEKWRGGEMVLKPGKPGLQEKSFPIETLFHKVVMVRNRLRVLEQKINASKLAEDEKLELQSYITGCYGSLTSFNVLFADEADKFKGSGGD